MSDKKYILALDQGTTSSRCIIYDRKGEIISVAQQEFKQIYPNEGWVEHDAEEIWSSQMAVAFEAMLKAGLTYKNIEAIGITNQRETTVVWEKETGKPVHNAIVWQCRRTADYCDELKAQGLTDAIREKTGLIIDPYFSGTKLRWILENIPDAKEKAEAGELLFGTIETWLIWKMTGGRVHVTDYSNASRTMMFNIHTLKWDKEILDILGIPEKMLPEPLPSSQVYGETKDDLFGGPIKIAGAAGDQQAALFGQTCFDEGEAKSTYGTGNFLLLNTGEKALTSKNGLLTTIAWGLNGKVEYALEGSVFVCGAVIQWLRDELGLLKHSSDSEEIAKSVEDTNGVYIVPAFVGMGAPYWDSRARGAIYGLTRGAGKSHLIRAALESIAYQCNDLIKAMEADMGHTLTSLYVDGGASANDFLMQFQSDILNLRVIRPKSVETTSLGAAYLAGLATGYWKDLGDVDDNWQMDRTFEPNMDEEKRKRLLEGWKAAVDRTLSRAKSPNEDSSQNDGDEKSPLFETARLKVWEATEKEIHQIIEIEHHPDNRNFIWQGSFEDHLGEIKDPNHLLLIFRDEKSPTDWHPEDDGYKTLTPDFKGYALIHMDFKSNVFEIRRIAIAEKGKGYGREAMEALIDYAFDKAGSNRLWLDVYPDNDKGIKLYESLGMHRDGMLRESYKSERGYLNQIIYSILRAEYEDKGRRE